MRRRKEMEMTTITDMWEASQSLHGKAIDSTHEPKLRANICRNAYDDQSHARLEAWTEEHGWETVRNLPIQGMSVATHSYVDPRRDDLPWRRAMTVDLLDLLEWGRDFFKKST